MSDELLPCPFCGKKARKIAANLIICSDTVNCGAEVHFDAQCTNDAATKAWNTRSEQSSETKIAHNIFAGILYDFGAYLTTRDERLTASAVDNAAPMADAIVAFAAKRGLCLDDPATFDWPKLLDQK